jgi:Protein of unknown function (DUF2721)
MASSPYALAQECSVTHALGRPRKDAYAFFVRQMLHNSLMPFLRADSAFRHQTVRSPVSFPLDPDTVSHGIQLAVAPVFLLTAVSGMIGVVANRLARIIDRARALEERVRSGERPLQLDADYIELGQLRTRGLLANGSIGLLTLCAFLIGVTIVVLFLGETIDFQMLRISIASFLAGVVCFLLALACFMAETMIATRLLNFVRAPPPLRNHKK